MTSLVGVKGASGRSPFPRYLSNMKESCTKCPGFQCVDTPTGRVLTEMKTMRHEELTKSVAECPRDLVVKLVDDILWEAQTNLKGWSKTKAFIERVENDE